MKMQVQKGKCKDDIKSYSLDCFEQVERSKTSELFYHVLNHDPFFHSGPFSVLERPFPVLECPFPVFLSFCFWESDFVPGRPRTEDFVPGFLLLLLSRHKGTAGQGIFLSQDKGTSGQGTFFVLGQRDNGMFRPGLSGDVTLGNPSFFRISYES